MSLTEGSVLKKMTALWLPMIGGIIAVKAIDLSDAYFVGQLGENPLAAIGFTFPIVMTLVSISIGLSAGASSVLSRAIGRGASKNQQQSLITGAIAMAAMVSVVVSLAGHFGIETILRLMGAEGEALSMALAYMRIWFFGIAFLIVPVAINGMLRATGDTKTPSLMMTATALLNIALNPLFIFGAGPFPEMGVEGAAIATVFARVLLLATALFILWKRRLLCAELSAVKRGLERWREIARIGLPASLSTSLNPIALSVITTGVATLGNAEVAAFGVVTKIQSFAMVPVLALSAAISPFAGQNSSANKCSRTRTALWWCCAISVAWCVFISVGFLLLAGPVVGLFDGSSETQDAAKLYLMIVPLSLAGYGAVITLSAALNGLGHAITALSISGGRAILMLVPFGYGGAVMFGFSGLSWGIALANVLAGTVAVLTIYRHAFSARD